MRRFRKHHNNSRGGRTKALLGTELFIAAFLVLAVFGIFIANPSQKNQVKIGATYMTMNNSFYPVLNEQVANYVDYRHGRLYNRDPALIVDK
ncbi:sugar ABC transporter substrate-binding protein, partial [Lactobacillus sp. XV13L]|nr:sugar ABC transporter substrate-binding protein [Lactobacillus sp. XV13L]